MKVVEPSPIRSTPAAGGGRSVPPAEDGGGSGGDAPADNRREPALDQDIAAVHGVVADEFTPSVQEAMANLIGEVAGLREALDSGNKRLDYLATLADQDSLCALLNRRAFMREVSRALRFADQGRTGSTLVFFEVADVKRINLRHGLAAGDATIDHVAGILRERFEDGVVAGRLGGAEFGLLLVGEPAEFARDLAENLATTLAALPLIWEGREIALSMQWGVHALLSGEDVIAAMNAADRAMRGAAN